MRATNASSNKRRKVFSAEAKGRIKKHGADFVKFINKETNTRMYVTSGTSLDPIF
jgi:hypothetical protein